MSTATDRDDHDDRGRGGDLASLLDPRSLPLRHQFGLVGLVLLAIFPLFVPTTDIPTFIGAIYLMLFAMSWDAVSGYTGQISLGHAFFFTLGGYGSAILNIQHGLNPFLSIPIATAVAALGGLLIGVPALRVRGPYLALITLILIPITRQLFVLFSDSFLFIAPEGLGGNSGFTTPTTPLVGAQPGAVVTVGELGGLGRFVVGNLASYYVAFLLFLIVLVVLLAITRSDAGNVFKAIQADENAVAASGLNPAKFKIFAFVLSATVGGLAGAMAVHSPALNPLPQQLLTIELSLTVIIAAVIGGIGTIVGAAVGAFAFELTEFIFGLSTLQFQLPLIGQSLEDLFPLPLFLIGVLTLFFLPEGIVPGNIELGRDALAWLRQRRGDREAAADGGESWAETEFEPAGRRNLEATSSSGGRSGFERTAERYRERTLEYGHDALDRTRSIIRKYRR
jgi:branched-chain amino acid transport system permease protein